MGPSPPKRGRATGTTLPYIYTQEKTKCSQIQIYLPMVKLKWAKMHSPAVSARSRHSNLRESSLAQSKGGSLVTKQSTGCRRGIHSGHFSHW